MMGPVVGDDGDARIDGLDHLRAAAGELIQACRAVLDSHSFDPHPTLSGLLQQDAWARAETSRWTC